MKRTIALLTFSLIISGIAYVWAETGIGRTNQAGRYSIAVSGSGDAYLVDTSNGCVWRAVKVSFPSPQSGAPPPPFVGDFKLVAVEGIVEMARPESPPGGPSGLNANALPAKCLKP